MSDDPIGTVNVEDDGPPAPAAAEPAAPAPAAAAEPAPAEPTAAEVESVDVGGQKYVPLAAVLAERREKQSLKAQAERAHELEQYVNQLAPYARFLQAHPELMQPQAPAPTAAQPSDDPQATEVAQMFDLYTADGKPDVTRAARFIAWNKQQIDQGSQAMVRPWAQQTLKARMEANWGAALRMTDADGKTVDPQALTAVWQQIQQEPNGINILSDPNGVAFVVASAFGFERLSRKSGPAAPAAAPVFTEPSGGATRAPQRMTELEQKIASQRGMKDQDWQKVTQGFRAGRPSMVEDD